MNKIKKYIPEITTIALGLGLIILNLVTFSLGHNYNSDEVAIQSMLDEGALLSGNKWFGISSFIFKLPFIYFGSLFETHSKLGIFIPSLLVVVLGFGLFIVSFIYFARQLSLPRKYYLFSLWLATLGNGFVIYFFNLNSRNIEIGVIFASLAIAHYYLNRSIKPSPQTRLLTLALLGLWAFIVASDHFYIYMVGLPLIIFGFWQYYKTRSKKYLGLVIFPVACILVGLSLMFLLNKLGFINLKTFLAFTDYSDLVSKLQNTPYILIDFIGMSFFGDLVLLPRTIKDVVSSGILLLGFVATISILLYQSKIKDKFTLIFPFMAVFGYCVWLLSDKNFSYYLILLPFLFVFCLMIALKYLWPKYSGVVIVIVAISIVLNTIFITKDLKHNYLNHKSRNANNYELINTIKAEGYNKGYALFWDSGINSYLSGNSIHFIQTGCVDNKIVIRPWYLAERDLNMPAQKTFFAFNSVRPEECTKELIREQLGDPSKTIESGGFTVYLFNYDIISRMQYP